MPITRRALLAGTAATLAGVAFPLSRLLGRTHHGNVGRFGPLVPDPKGVLALPRGFSYRILQRSGESMSDGYVVPGAFDGMACFPGPEGTLVLMRNHENTWVPFTGPYRAGQAVPSEAYDARAQGAVTRVVIDAETLAVRSSNLVLAGTVRNCAGGASPWGWLSCEETTETNHGYVFLCPTDAERIRPPQRLDGYGRFRHEAACVDDSTLVAYLTEDQDDGCFYRMVPNSRDAPFVGRLEALCVDGASRLDTSREMTLGKDVEVSWAHVTRPTPEDDSVRKQAREKGAARVKRGEGIWRDGDRIFFSSTTGGPREAGQIFRLTLGRNGQKDKLALISQSTSTAVLDMPDNVTVAPWGEVFLAEDSVLGVQHLRIVSSDGTVSDFARNEKSRSELAGVCFSPKADTLFVNLYGDGLTLAIRGPFRT